MNKINIALITTTFLITSLFSCLGRADTFDDAVTLYLKGFDHCSEAKEALDNNKMSQAQKALNQYKRIEEQAAKIDPSILTSNKRGMASNLKYCNRVAKDAEIELGTPLINDAIDACNAASDALKSGNSELANQYFSQFTTMKDEALATAPSLTSQFSTRSQINRCKRLEKKIASHNKKQASLALAIESVIEDSKAYNTSCQNSLNTLNKSSLSQKHISAAQTALNNANTSKASAQAETLAIKQLEQAEDKTQYTAYLTSIQKGDRCATQLTSAINAKSSKLIAQEKELNKHTASLKQAKKRCAAVSSQPSKDATDTIYSKAKKDYQLALRSRNSINNALKKNEFYQQNEGAPSSKETTKTLTELNICLKKSKRQLAVISGAIPKINVTPVIAVPAPAIPAAKTTASSKPIEKKSPPASDITGTVKLQDSLAEFAIIYMDDGSKPGQDAKIVLALAGFDKDIYVLGNEEKIQIKSENFATHKLKIEVDHRDYEQKLKPLRSRQTTKAEASWPENTIATLSSNKANIAPAYLAKISSKNHTIAKFNLESNNLTFEIQNPEKATTGYLLLPGYDPVEIKLTTGESKSVPITQGNQTVGNVELKGI